MIGWYGMLKIGFRTGVVPFWKFVQKVMHRLKAPRLPPSVDVIVVTVGFLWVEVRRVGVL